MWKVMRNGTIGATIAYLMAGIFGYATFAKTMTDLLRQDDES